MNKLEKYLNDAFGIQIYLLPLKNDDIAKLPVYMRNYNLKTADINNRKIVLIIADDYLEFTTEKFKKQADLIEKLLGLPVVFVIENLESYKRKRLIEKKVAFAVPGKQLYIPYLFIEMREAKTHQIKKKEKFSPAAQCLLLYYLLGNKIDGLNFKTLAKKLNYGQMTITRAAYTLKEYNFCLIKGGKSKTVIIEKDKKQIWNEALPFLNNPVEKEIYVDEIKVNDNFYVTGINALANYTKIANDNKKTFAVYKERFKYLNIAGNNDIYDKIEGNINIQTWKYDPGNLTENNYVDPLSLYLSLSGIEDERIEKELDNLIGKLWSME